MGVCQTQEKILHLGKRQKCRSGDDVDAQFLQRGVVEVKGVLKRELTPDIRLLDPRVFNNIDLAWGPAGSDVGYHSLLEQRPGACESDQEGGRDGEIVFLVEVGGRNVPFRDRGWGGCREEGEVFFYWRRSVGWCGFVFGSLFFVVGGGFVVDAGELFADEVADGVAA